MTDVDVTVAIVAWNSQRDIGAILRTIPAALGGLRGQVVIADNRSSDETVTVARTAAPEAIIVQTGRNGGYAWGLNAALRHAAPSRAVLACNPDVRLAPGSVHRLFGALNPARGVGIAVPRLTDPDGVTHRSLRREPTVFRALGEAVLGGHRAGRFPMLGEVIVDPVRYVEAGPVDWAVGAVMLVARECADAVGDWDESFFLYSEETDFALRARDAGFRTWYVPDAVAVHRGGDLHRSEDLWALQAVNRVRLYRSRHGAPRSVAFWFAVATNEVIRSMFGRRTNRTALRRLISAGVARSRPVNA